jgi:hypothetical protein
MSDLKSLYKEHDALMDSYTAIPWENLNRFIPGEDKEAALRKLENKNDEILNHEDYRDFKSDLAKALGDKIKEDDDVARSVYAALCNVDWEHEKGTQFGCSWRHAGDIIAEIRERGDYLDWYCSGNEGVVDDAVAEAMALLGWLSTPLDE